MFQTIINSFSVVFFAIFLYILYKYIVKRGRPKHKISNQPFPENYRSILQKRVLFYQNLTVDRKLEFEKRILRFLAEKNINGIDTEVLEEDKLLVAASAIIPMFAFPYYNYPSITEVLLYPNSFDHNFRTNKETEGRNILGMVGEGFLNGEVLLSKPDLESAFDGTRHKENVGIHEFIHLIDKADGTIDGIPDILIQHSYALSWLNQIKLEMNKIKHGHSDISPYALTNNAEFLAVVSEYFFDNPDKMKTHHPELYQQLTSIFHQKPNEISS